MRPTKLRKTDESEEGDKAAAASKSEDSTEEQSENQQPNKQNKKKMKIPDASQISVLQKSEAVIAARDEQIMSSVP